MNIDVTTSTVTINDHRLPATCVICPPCEGYPEPEVERMLGGPAISRIGAGAGKLRYQVLIPGENGLLVAVESSEEHPGIYEINLEARSCYLSRQDPEGPLWLPHSVALHSGRLVSDPDPVRRRITRVASSWRGAEPDWTVELIAWVTHLPFQQPEGPEVKLVTLAYAEELLREAHQ